MTKRNPAWKEPSWKQSKARYYCDVLKEFPESFSNPDTLVIEPKFLSNIFIFIVF
jgi:hypothetical protein